MRRGARSAWKDPLRPTRRLAVITGAVLLLVALVEVPYHIDELRQVSSYRQSLVQVMRESSHQQQPPLDAWIGSIAQKLLGQGDIRQRLPSVVWGIGTLVLLSHLLTGFGLRWGAPLAVLIFATSPLMVTVTAYARPYALPTFLMLAWIVSVRAFIERGSSASALTMTAIAICLPASRAVVPLVFLLATTVTLGWCARTAICGDERSRSRFAAGIAALGLLACGLPIIWLLAADMRPYVSDSPLEGGQLLRGMRDLPSALRMSFPVWSAAALAALLAIAMPSVRQRLFSQWWWWTLLCVPFGFAVCFFALTPTTQPYSVRYTFTFWLPFVLLIGAGFDAAQQKWRAGQRVVPGAYFATVCIFLLGSVTQLDHALTESPRPDWMRFSAYVSANTPLGTTVLFDWVRPAGAWRGSFAGSQRYLEFGWSVPSVSQVARGDRRLRSGSPLVVALLGASPQVPGWTRLRFDQHFSLYRPDEPLRGNPGAIQALEQFAAALGPATGATMVLSAAALRDRSGQADAARSIVARLLATSGDDLRIQIEREIERLGLSRLRPGSRL